MADIETLHEALEILVAEHRVIRRVLALLMDIADEAVDGADVDADVLRDGIDFLRQFADARHHGKEEDILFAEARSLDVAAGGLIEEMMAEHVDARGRVSALEFAVQDYADGHGDAAAALADAVADVDLLYQEHIEKEDRLLFPMLQEVLQPGQLDQLLLSFRKADARTGAGFTAATVRLREAIGGPGTA